MKPHNTTTDQRVAAVAAAQHHCFSRRQALDVGASPSLIARRLRAGRWTIRHPGVYAVAQSPDPWLQGVWAAFLAVRSDVVLSHTTAAALYRLPGYPPDAPVELIAPHGTHHRVDGAIVHQIDDLQPHHVIALADHPGLAVTTTSRTVVDLAARASPSRLRAVITDGVAGGTFTIAEIGHVLGDVARTGKPGVRRLGQVIDDLVGKPVPRSLAERAFLAVLDRHGVRRPDAQVSLPGRGAVVGVVDAMYRDARLIVEIDGRRWHGRFADMARDRARDAEAARAGYLTLRFLYEHIVSDPGWVAATVAAVLVDRGLRRAS
jgi:hypothetical protein